MATCLLCGSDRVAGTSNPRVFPLPRVPYGGGRGEKHFRISWVNLLVLFLNLLNSSGGAATTSELPPSAAQQRCLDFLGRQVASPSPSTCRVSEPEAIDACLRHSHGYARGDYTLPLGRRAGVPPKAADVDLAGALLPSNPQFSKQVIFRRRCSCRRRSVAS